MCRVDDRVSTIDEVVILAPVLSLDGNHRVDQRLLQSGDFYVGQRLGAIQGEGFQERRSAGSGVEASLFAIGFDRKIQESTLYLGLLKADVVMRLAGLRQSQQRGSDLVCSGLGSPHKGDSQGQAFSDTRHHTVPAIL